jgi:phospholipase C
MYLLAATSSGHAHTPTATVDARTIFQALDEAGITWKVYVTDVNPAVSPSAPNAMMLSSYMHYFNWSAGKLDHFVPLEPTYFNDVQNGTLPQVALIESGYFSGRDEHPNAGQHIQFGAKYVSGIINALIASPSWKDSVFIWTFDEGGGAFEHVPPQVAVAPDNIAPLDLSPKDPALGFTRTGFRVPMFIVSPFAKKNFVSHTPMDYTAIDHFIETRFGLSPLTARDAAQPDMTEFFDFTNGGPWATPPAQGSIPVQQVLPPCTTSLP